MQANEFLGGVVEGFYGRPWTNAQRQTLFRKMAAWGLNTYCYAPKDDLKHRALWRECYSDAEMDVMRALIDGCQRHELKFIYGLSPGLDIRFSSDADRDRVKQRLAQLLDAGCQHFALLFDDLPGRMADEDRLAYSSVAEAQSAVANDVFASVRSRVPESRFLFCPTPYCDRMDRWQLAGEGYLETIGQQLDASIDVLWTGPEIVSREISVESIQSLTERLHRRPLIWDNLHANDYDGGRVFTGPYAGRPIELKQHVAGILTNPNCEFSVNEVPLRTLAAYLANEGPWQPREAFLSALAQWLEDYETVGDPIALDDLRLLADCYYLPYEEGPEAKRMYDLITQLVERPVSQWNGADEKFAQLNERVQTLFDQLTQLRDRELFYAWSRRAWDLKEELQLIEGYLEKKRAGNEPTEVETHLPGTYRGGMVARLQRLLTMDDHGRFAARQGQ